MGEATLLALGLQLLESPVSHLALRVQYPQSGHLAMAATKVGLAFLWQHLQRCSALQWLKLDLQTDADRLVYHTADQQSACAMVLQVHCSPPHA